MIYLFIINIMSIKNMSIKNMSIDNFTGVYREYHDKEKTKIELKVFIKW